MVTIEDVIKEVSKQTDIDIETVNVICRHPFLYTVEIMKDENDLHEILFNKLFKFKLKPRFKNNKTLKYSPKL